jgi:hypothetical protein
VRNCYELGDCRQSKESIVCCLEVNYLKLQVFNAEVFSSPEGHEKSDLANGGRCCARDYAMKQGSTGVLC